MNILATGAAGYIGSHTCVELLANGYSVIAVDNLANSSEESLKRVREITGKPLAFYKIDILDSEGLKTIFKKHDIDAVIHFAGLKAVGESVQHPLQYYKNNVSGTLELCRIMQEFSVKNIVFSSSATVYGTPEKVPITEDCKTAPINPYGRTKLIIEDILKDIHISDNEWQVGILRYFNPVGAHKSGSIGEAPNGIPNNLFPYIAQVAAGKRKELKIFGSDYSTKDGTGVRDYIHVTDLARGHLKTLGKLRDMPGVVTYNLGTGRGYSVLEAVSAFSRACNKDIKFRKVPRRAGDVAVCFADPASANTELNWKAEKDLQAMCEDTWRWQQQNPNGYTS
jgi:UDP-glucose 4-epimerase